MEDEMHMLLKLLDVNARTIMKTAMREDYDVVGTMWFIWNVNDVRWNSIWWHNIKKAIPHFNLSKPLVVLNLHKTT